MAYSDSSASELAKVSVKFTPLWRSDPEIWFNQIEAQFINLGITKDATKYYHIIGTVESDVLSKVSDIVKNPPTENKYKALKERLIRQFADSENLKLKKVLAGVQFGDKRPSEVLLEMRNLAGHQLNDDVLKSLWMDGLPSQAQAILAVSEDNLDKLSIMADKIVETVSHTKSSSIMETSSSNNIETRLELLEKQITSLNNNIAALSIGHNSRSRSRSNSHNKNRSISRPRFNKEGKFCWYHFTFGQNAKKCSQPCSFNNNNKENPKA